MKAIISISLAILMSSQLLNGAGEEAAQEVAKPFKIKSNLATSLAWSVQDGNGVVDILLPGIADGLPMPKPPSTQVWLLKTDGTSFASSSKPGSPNGTSMAGVTIPHLVYSFSPAAASSAVAVVVQVEEDFFVFPLVPRTKPAEQGGAGQPATRSESKSDGNENPKPEADARSR